MATEILPIRFDAIVVDEAQDFGEEYWFPIELLLRDSDRSTLFIFFDHNQAIYRRVRTFPIKDEPFLLTIAEIPDSSTRLAMLTTKASQLSLLLLREHRFRSSIHPLVAVRLRGCTATYSLS